MACFYCCCVHKDLDTIWKLSNFLETTRTTFSAPSCFQNLKILGLFFHRTPLSLHFSKVKQRRRKKNSLFSVASLRSLGEEGTRCLHPLTRLVEPTERHQRLREGVRRLRIVGIVLAKDVLACLGAPVQETTSISEDVGHAAIIVKSIQGISCSLELRLRLLCTAAVNMVLFIC